MINTQTTVGEIVRAVPGRARIFEKLNIDYCCGGKKPLAEVCQGKGLDPATVLAMLEAFDGAPVAAVVDPDTMTLTQLCDHIQQMHHEYLREELPRLDFLTRKVAAVHGAHEPRLVEIRRVFESFSAEMSAHTTEEDQTVFPAIRRLESDGGAAAGELSAMVEKLSREHDNAGAALEQFNELSDNCTPPEWACNTYRTMFDALAHLQEDLHQHVHKENNVLFPKVLALAKASAAQCR